jgi:CDP-diacylglycerol---glycerol-3-phosphate 3-phosphatidyltransferase
MNFPNTLSLLRIVLAPVFLYLFLSGSVLLIQFSFFVFAIAALTDWYDGWYARKYGFKTKWGRFLDPLADKVLTSAAFIGFYLLNKEQPSWFGQNEFVSVGILVGIIIARDIILTIVRSYNELKGKEFKTSLISKSKTFAQMTYVFFLLGLIFVKVTFLSAENFIDKFLFSEINYYLLFLLTVLTVLSGIAYFFELESV